MEEGGPVRVVALALPGGPVPRGPSVSGQAEESMALSPWREEWVGRDGGAPEGNPT